VQHLTALNLPDITFKCSVVAVFVIVNISNISQTKLSNVFMIHLSIKFHTSVSSGSLAVASELKSKYKFCAVANLLCYVLQKTTVMKPSDFRTAAMLVLLGAGN
jgi:hypothetical protein